MKDGSDVEAIKTAVEGLVTASQGFAQKLYEASANESGGGDGGSGFGGATAADDEEVVDAEIVDDDQQA